MGNADNVVSAGSSTVIFGALGTYVAFMLMNWKILAPVRTQLCCIIGLIIFFSILSSLTSRVDAMGHLGGLIGGFLISLTLFPAIVEKPKYLIGIGGGGLAGYFLTTFLVLFLS